MAIDGEKIKLVLCNNILFCLCKIHKRGKSNTHYAKIKITNQNFLYYNKIQQ